MVRSDGAEHDEDGNLMAKRLPAAAPVLPGFSYVRPLGTGGFADVFLYEQNMPRRSVAVKVLLQDAVDEGVLRMFNAEADIMAKLSAHPSILNVFEASVSSDGRPYLVMEYCPSSYASRFRTERIPLQEVLHTTIKMAGALETVHRAGVLHRDVKPSNILTTTFGIPVLSDFGISTSLHTNAEQALAMSVPWSAPEVVLEQTSGTIASEVWSLGATAYSLLAGHSPFEIPGSGKNRRDELKSRIAKAKVQPIGRPDVPPQIEAIFVKTMARQPKDRYASMLEFAKDLHWAQSFLGLPPTQVEVASEAWAQAGPKVDFENVEVRGPVRSSVQASSRRKGLQPGGASRASRDARPAGAGRGEVEDGTVLRGSREARRGLPAWAIALISAGSALALAGAAVAFILAASGS